jgi:hypothetical protein
MDNTPTPEAIARLIGARRTGGGWLGACPVCQPERRRDQAALSIGQGDGGRVLLRCFKSGCGYREIVAALGVECTPAASPTCCTRPAPANDPDDRTAAALRIWTEAVPVNGTPAETYLMARCGTLPAAGADVVRWHSRCPFTPGNRTGCLVSLARSVATGLPMAIQRTALTATGERQRDPWGKKLDKMGFGPTGGCAIMVSPDWAVETALAVAEGLETALAAFARWPHLPTWSLINSEGVKGLSVMPGVGLLRVYADADKAGRDAAETVSERWRKAGRTVEIFEPVRDGADFAELEASR